MSPEKKQVNIAKYIPVAFMLCTVFVLIAFSHKFRNLLSPTGAINVALVFTASIFQIMLLLAVITDSYYEKYHSFLFCGTIVSMFFCTIFSGFMYVTAGTREHSYFTFTMNNLAYICANISWLFFWLYIESNNKKRKKHGNIVAIFIFLYTLCLIVNQFVPFITQMDENGNLIRNPILTSGFYLILYILVFISILCSSYTKKEKLVFMSFILLPVVCLSVYAVLEYNGKVIMEGAGDICSAVVLYIVFFNIYRERGNQLSLQESALVKTRADAMLRQINPHFIANTLNSIVSLCRFNPKEAERVTRLFADYLRENYVGLTGESMTSFDNVLKNMKNYMAIEQVRFPKIQVEYDIQCSDFYIPTLTIQPLIENAINHGIRKKENIEGVIKISSAETKDAYIVRIADDGVGFEKLPQNEKNHVGIANAQARLRMLCDGSLTIKSEPGCGTECEIVIPKKEATAK